MMATDDHGSCLHCGSDLNGERVYDHFLKEYGGDWQKALAAASMYGCRKGYGRFSKSIYVTSYDTEGNKLPKYWKCPECGERCYERNKE